MLQLFLGILVLGAFAWSWSKMGTIMSYWTDKDEETRS